MRMSGGQRQLIADLGPYTLRKDGVLLDSEGVALCSLRPHTTSEECAWDLAVVASLNEITRQLNPQPAWGVFDILDGRWWPRRFLSQEEAENHLARCRGQGTQAEVRILGETCATETKSGV